MMHWYGTGWSWWAASLMWVGMIAFWAVVIWGVCALIASSQRGDEDGRTDDPRRILDGRLARGEIDPDEYHRRLEAMGTGSQASGSVGRPR
jgi:putative membrane protein